MATTQTYRTPSARSDLPIGILIGVAFSFALFVLMALAQVMGKVEKPSNELEETLIAMQPPEIEEIEEVEPPPEPEPEPEPEMAEPPPDISLESLDVALNPGTGGNLMGDFALPTFAATQEDMNMSDLVDFADLDSPPELLDKSPPRFPKRLLKQAVNGKVVLGFVINADGTISDVHVVSSTVPSEYGEFLVSVFKKRSFKPLTAGGRPTGAKGEIPLPVRIGK